MNVHLLNPEVADFLKTHFKEDVSRLILNGSPFPEITTKELAQQIIGLQKSENKLPTWFSTKGIYFPPKLNLEQTSSESTAKYKASLFSGENALDLTGGFGIDDYYLSSTFKQVTHCELNTDLATIASHNYKKLGVSSVEVVQGDSIAFLKNTNTNYDLIYVDPSRRNDNKGKVFMLKDCEPNIPALLDLLFEKTKHIRIKTSPLLDISAGLKELDHVTEIHAIAVKNEVKELLWVLKKNKSTRPLKLVAVNLESDCPNPVSLDMQSLQNAEADYEEPQDYLYEPNAALMKLGAFNWISEHYNLKKIAPNSHLYTSKSLIEFPGRIFKINDVIAYSKKEISNYLKNKKAHITTRNFKENTAALRTKFKVKDGGDIYLFFTTLTNGKQILISAAKP